MEHDGFSVIECLSECTEFYPGAFDAANPRKGGVFNLVPADHDVTDELAAYKLAMADFPGYFGVFYQVQRPTKNALEAKLIADAKAKVENAAPVELLQKTFTRLS
jgi:2-oxoglutarate ferredoxin oxidoreductase subunit beta